MIEWLALIGVTFGALLPIANPFSTAPAFVALTRRMGSTRRNQQARLAGFYMACVLLVALLAGALVLEFFGISMPALRMAGGLIIARLGFSMLRTEPEPGLSAAAEEAALDNQDIAFTPIAMPLLSGPGSIAVTISMATNAVHNPLDYVAVAIGILLVSAVSWGVLRSAARVVDFMGPSGVQVLTRLMGLILVCIGVQFVVNGFVELITDPGIVSALTRAYPE